ncbi:MAG: polysaccharide biosynthesis protein, partial [Planctomycetes bacterium]|nr:polysaccharide biosynthesis protein [Planctomycetota bacterium]
MPTAGPKSDPAAANGGILAGLMRRLAAAAFRHRLATNVVLHTILFALALLLAHLVRFDTGMPGGGRRWFLTNYVPWLPVFVGLKLLIFARLRLFRGGWQYSGIRDVTNILLGCWLFVLIMFAAVNLFRYVPRWITATTGRTVSIPVVDWLIGYFSTYSQGVLVLDFLASVFLVCTARLSYRLYREELRPVSPEGVRRVLIVGAGSAAETIIRQIHRTPQQRYHVVGMVDDDPDKRHIQIHGVPVLGTTEQIRSICEERKVEEIIIAMPSASQKQLRRVIDLCSGTKLKFKSLPSVDDLIDGRVTVSQIREVDIHDLLGRKAVELDRQALGRFLHGKRVLITGAGGSIGSEMCRQVCRFGPKRLLLVEQAETPLFD